MADLKTRLIQLLDLSHSFRQQLMADLDPVERTAKGTWEEWSIKDELAHIIAWQANSVARIAALTNQETLPDFDDFEKINRSIYDTNRDRSLADILADGDRTRADYEKIIESFSEDDLDQPARFSDQEKRSLVEMIVGNGFEHPTLHYANYYLRHGDLARATQLQETSVTALAEMPTLYGAARYNLACFYALSGQNEKAVNELCASFPLRPDLMEWSKQDTDLDSLRDDPAFQALYP